MWIQIFSWMAVKYTRSTAWDRREKCCSYCALIFHSPTRTIFYRLMTVKLFQKNTQQWKWWKKFCIYIVLNRHRRSNRWQIVTPATAAFQSWSHVEPYRWRNRRFLFTHTKHRAGLGKSHNNFHHSLSSILTSKLLKGMAMKNGWPCCCSQPVLALLY